MGIGSKALALAAFWSAFFVLPVQAIEITALQDYTGPSRGIGGSSSSSSSNLSLYYSIASSPTNRALNTTVQPINGSVPITLSATSNYGFIGFKVKYDDSLYPSAQLSICSSSPPAGCTNNTTTGCGCPIAVSRSANVSAEDAIEISSGYYSYIYAYAGNQTVRGSSSVSDGICTSSTNICTGAIASTSADALTETFANSLYFILKSGVTVIDSGTVDLTLERHNISSAPTLDYFPGDKKFFAKIGNYSTLVTNRWYIFALDTPWPDGPDGKLLPYDILSNPGGAQIQGPFDTSPTEEYTFADLKNDRTYYAAPVYVTSGNAVDSIPADRIQTIVPSAVVGALTENKCIVSTTLYGEHHWITQTLRAFRNLTLVKFPMGQQAVKTYYKVSGSWIDLVKHNSFARFASECFFFVAAVSVWQHGLVLGLLLGFAVMVFISRRKLRARRSGIDHA